MGFPNSYRRVIRWTKKIVKNIAKNIILQNIL